MISTRLQQTLNSRIELIESLLLIYAYSELINPRLQEYRQQNQKIHEKEVLLLEAYQHIFKIDDNFRKLFYNLVIKVFQRLNSKYKPTPKPPIGRITAVYRQFLVFFKIANELEIIRYLQKTDIENTSENQLFVILTGTLIRYLKSKTDAIILKLKQKCRKEDIDFYQENTIKTIDCRRVLRRPNPPLRRIIPPVNTQKPSSPSIFVRKYHSQQRERMSAIASQRTSSRSKKSVKISTFQSECKQLSQRQSSAINWRAGLRKLKEVYSEEWETYLSLVRPLQQELEQTKTKGARLNSSQKRQWIFSNFNAVYKEVAARNQALSRNFPQKQKDTKVVDNVYNIRFRPCK